VFCAISTKEIRNMNYVIGFFASGEQLRFERWVYEAWRCNTLKDPLLVASLNRCMRFEILY
jgi:hypothetical protein